MTKRDWIVLSLCLIVALANLAIFGVTHVRSWDDAQEYNAFAVHLVSGQGYSLDGVHFSDYREPGYPAFLALVYSAFGTQNFDAAAIAQALLVGICGFLIYKLFARSGNKALAIAAGLLVCAIPYYGYYSYEILSEIFFTFTLALLFYFAAPLASDAKGSPLWKFALFGSLCGCAVLVREQMLFFLPFLIVCYALFVRVWSGDIVRKMLLACIVCVCVIAPWALYVHVETGMFAISGGRQQEEWYIRADRAALSYSQLNEYAIDWLKYSLSGGTQIPFLAENDYSYLQQQYEAIATTSAEVSMLQAQNISTIVHDPAHYLYDNAIEVMKLLYIDHTFGTVLNKYVRASVYVILYASALWGIWQLLRSRKGSEYAKLSVLAMLFIAYNCAILSFFDTVPRYNTPYLFFYLVIAAAGLGIYLRSSSVESS
jgi:4-amino-4-deoxy-L-arabinose transferase-like glycosyltransferase